MTTDFGTVRLSLEDIAPVLDKLEGEYRAVCEERNRLRAAIEVLLADEELQLPVLAVRMLKKALGEDR